MHPSRSLHHTRRVFSGIQPTGILHLGNYIGAVKNWLQLQDKEVPKQITKPLNHTNGNSVTMNTVASAVASSLIPPPSSVSVPTYDRKRCIFSIVDLHAMTMPYQPHELKNQVHFMTSTLLACGLDPERVLLYTQSHVREHTELAWILSCITPLGWLQRMTQFKTKIQQQSTTSSSSPSSIPKNDKLSDKKISSSPLGLLSYPVLQTADIVLYKATHVPVGEDQYQHLELARDISIVFNNRYGNKDASVTDIVNSLSSSSPTIDKSIIGNGIFPLPQTLSLPIGARIMSLRDGTKKMSKSDKDDNTRINLNDTPETIQQKIKIAKTDTEVGFGTYDPVNRPEKANLLSIYSALSGRTIDDLCTQYQNSSAVQFKKELTEVIVHHLQPIQQNLQRYTKEPGYVQQVLEKGGEEAREIAVETMKEVREAVGYR